MSGSEVSTSSPAYRLFVLKFLTSKEAEAHFDHFLFSGYLGEGERLERNVQRSYYKVSC